MILQLNIPAINNVQFYVNYFSIIQIYYLHLGVQSDSVTCRNFTNIFQTNNKKVLNVLKHFN